MRRYFYAFLRGGDYQMTEKVSNKPWGDIDKTVEAYGSAEEYCKACLIDLNESGQEKVASKCKLPIREPNGMLNRNGIIAAAAALAGSRGGVDAPLEEKRKAAKKLVSLYRNVLGEEPPERILKLAGMKPK